MLCTLDVTLSRLFNPKWSVFNRVAVSTCTESQYSKRYLVKHRHTRHTGSFKYIKPFSVVFFLFVAFFAFIRLFLYIFVISVRIFIFFSFIHMNVENQRTHNTIITILVLVIVCALAVLSLHQTFFKQQLFTIQIEWIILYWSTYFTFEKLFAARWLFTGAIVVVVFI